MQFGSDGTVDSVEMLTKINVWFAEQFAYLLTKLASIKEGTGTMLDNTLIVYIGDNGEQHHSTASEFPTLLIGGRGMGMKPGGRTLIYPGLTAQNHRQISNVWNTLGHLAGAPLDIPTTERLVWDTYRYGKLLEGDVTTLESTSASIASTLSLPFTQLSYVYSARGQRDKLLRAIERAMQLTPNSELRRALAELVVQGGNQVD